MKQAISNQIKTAAGWIDVPKDFQERKSISNTTAELKDIDFKNKIVTCYVSAFGNKDFDDDVMMKGCYAKTIAERGPNGTNEIFYLKSHNWELPLGKPSLIREDDKGLYFETACTSGTTFSEDTLKLMDAGLMVQNSVGFQTIKYNMVTPDPNDWNTWYREITQCKLYEGSAVVLGANDQTPFEGFKSLTSKEISSLIGRVMKTIRSGDLRDETYGRLEIALKQLYTESFLLGSKSLITQQPVEETTVVIDEPVSVKSFYAGFANTGTKPKSFYELIKN